MPQEYEYRKTNFGYHEMWVDGRWLEVQPAPTQPVDEETLRKIVREELNTIMYKIIKEIYNAP